MPRNNRKPPSSSSTTAPSRRTGTHLLTIGERPRRVRRLGACMGVALLVLMAGAGCARAATQAQPVFGSGSVLAPAPVDFSARGPYPVGTVAVDAGATKAVVYYPADPTALDRVRHLDAYDLDDA